MKIFAAIFSIFLLISPIVQSDRFHPRKTAEDIEAQQRPGHDPQRLNLEGNTEFWLHFARETLTQKLNQRTNNGKAKNIIMFLGDGLSLPTTAATRMYLGGEEVELSYEKFPYYGLAKTYCVNRQVADSACTG